MFEGVVAMTRGAGLVVIAAASSLVSSSAMAAPREAAVKLAATFASDVVGALVPLPVTAGDYAMSIEMRFHTFRNREMTISESLDGAMTLSLAADGSVRGCMASIRHTGSYGDGHYRRDHSTEPRTDDEYKSLVAFAGSWREDDGVAIVQFDRRHDGSCDDKAITWNALTAPLPTLRCLAVGATAKLPAGSLLCEAANADDTLSLGMPMAKTDRVVLTESKRQPPRGSHVVLAKSGLAVTVEHVARSGSGMPDYTFTPRPVSIVASKYTYGPKPRP